MKITKKQLNQIIEEETKAMVDEGWWPFGGKDEPEAVQDGAPEELPSGAEVNQSLGYPNAWFSWSESQDSDVLRRLWNWKSFVGDRPLWRWDAEKNDYVAVENAGETSFGSMWAALRPNKGETAQEAYKRFKYWERKNKAALEKHRAEREEEERMNPGGDDGDEYEWRRGDMRMRHRHRAKPLYENKIKKTDLKQLIKEVIKETLK